MHHSETVISHEQLLSLALTMFCLAQFFMKAAPKSLSLAILCSITAVLCSALV